MFYWSQSFHVEHTNIAITFYDVYYKTTGYNETADTYDCSSCSLLHDQLFKLDDHNHHHLSGDGES